MRQGSDAPLAIHGGEPVRRVPLPGAARALGDDEVAALTEVIRSGRLGRHEGSSVKRLEAEFARVYGAKHAIACASGTAAVHTAMGVVNPEPGDEIITSPCTDFGTVAGILFQNAIPVFADLQPDTFCIDPASVRARITPRTRAIVAVNLFGAPAELSELRRIADEHGIILIEDCAQAQLAEFDGRLAGTIGQMACFSLNSTKHLNAGEGGVVITNDDAMAWRARLFADKAWPRDEGRFTIFLAHNFRMAELAAAVALVGLQRLPDNVARRRTVAERVLRAIEGTPGVILPERRPGRTSSYWILHLFVAAGVDLDEAVRALQAEGIPFSGRYVTPLYLWPVLRERQTYGASGFPFNSPYTNRPFDYAPGLCPTFEAARERLLLLSLDEQMTVGDADDIAAAIRKVLPRLVGGRVEVRP